MDRVLGRRFLLIVAVLMGLTALAASVAPRDPRVSERQAATPTPAAPAPEATPGADPAPDADVVRTIDAARTGAPRRVRATVGERVAIIVESDELDSVALGELEVEAVDPDSPARFQLLAEEAGSHPITLLEQDRRIGVLEISD